MRKSLWIIISLVTIEAKCQQLADGLYGFKLGQVRVAATNELGKPIQSGKFDDGYEYEMFLLKPDTSLYMIFEYTAEHKDIIWSLQVTGTNSTTDIGFRGLTLGIDEFEMEKKFGKPDSIIDAEQYGKRWEYRKANYSFEINPKGIFSSVKISDLSNKFFPTAEADKIPSFESVQNILSSGDNLQILNLLAPDVEIYHKEETHFLKKSFKTESLTDFSHIISLIKELSKDLSTVKKEDYEENVRLVYGTDIKHVIKIKGHTIKEIVMKCYLGRYVIWEIKT
ncbi:MAG: hypothetical protein HY015_05990 [Bacteroidetes bacterium]|nr:hypothetical protein [Bacteroidota bacterium]MBI3482513.1 hypothetical protein [Bacteroidota bacterium]